MKTILSGLLAVAFLGAGLPGALALDKVTIKVQKKQDETTNEGLNANLFEVKSKETFHYEFTFENSSFADLAELTVSYIIFVEHLKLGSNLNEPGRVDRVAGSKNIEVLTSRAPETISSKKIVLIKKNSVGGMSHPIEGRTKADDNVVGVWVRVLQNGQVIGELTNPPGVTKRGWDAK